MAPSASSSSLSPTPSSGSSAKHSESPSSNQALLLMQKPSNSNEYLFSHSHRTRSSPQPRSPRWQLPFRLTQTVRRHFCNSLANHHHRGWPRLHPLLSLGWTPMDHGWWRNKQNRRSKSQTHPGTNRPRRPRRLLRHRQIHRNRHRHGSS